MPHQIPESGSAEDTAKKGARELADQAERTSGQDRADDAEQEAHRKADTAEQHSISDKGAEG